MRSSGRRRDLAEALGALRAVFAHPQLRRAELAFAFAWTSEWAFMIGLGVVAFRAGGATAVGVVALLRMAPAALLSPILVAVADRHPRERVLVWVSLSRAVALVCTSVVLHAGASPGVIYALAVVSTIAMTLFRPAHSALLPALCATTRELTSANVVRGLLDAAGTLVGPALAGVLLAVSGATAVFSASAALSLVAAAVLRGVHYDAAPPLAADRSPSLARDAADGVRAVAAHPDLRLVFGLGFAQTFIRGALNVLTVVVAFELIDSGEPGVAVLSAAVGAGGLVGAAGVSLLVGSRHLGAWLAVALVLWGGPIALLGVAPSQVAAVVLMLIVGIANAIIDVPLFTLPVRLASDAVLARVFGVFESLVALGVGLGSVVTPLAVSRLGVRETLVAMGLVLPVLAAMFVAPLRGLDRRLGVREDEIAVLRRSPMLGGLPVPSIEHLATRLRRVDVAAGTVLLAQGGTGGGFYVIREGEVDVVGDGGIVRTMGAGESFGEIALLHDVPRTATVRARTDVSAFELDPEDFLDAVSGFGASRDAASAVVAQHLAHFRPRGVGI